MNPFCLYYACFFFGRGSEVTALINATGMTISVSPALPDVGGFFGGNGNVTNVACSLPNDDGIVAITGPAFCPAPIFSTPADWLTRAVETTPTDCDWLTVSTAGTAGAEFSIGRDESWEVSDLRIFFL